MSLANGQRGADANQNSLPSGDSVDNGNAEPEDKTPKTSPISLIAVVAMIVAAIGGAVYWFIHDDTEK